MKRTPFIATLLAAAILTLGLLATHAALAAPPDGKGKPPKDDPPPTVLPDVRYRIELLPLLGETTVINKMNGLGMIVGRDYDDLLPGYHTFMYDHDGTGLVYYFDELPTLTAQLTELLGEGSRFSSAYGINDSGDMVGNVRDALGNHRGFLIDTSPDPDNIFDPDTTVWTVQLLPDLGGGFSRAYRINNDGIVLGNYDRPDGTLDAYLYDPSLPDGPDNPMPLGVDLSGIPELNNLGQVAGVQTDGTAFLFDPVAGIQLFNEVEYRSVDGLNDSGVFSGWTVTKVNGKGKSRALAFRYTDQLELIITDGGSAGAGLINASNDVVSTALIDGGPRSNYLAHTGFDPDYNEQVLNLDDLIDLDDPLRDSWINNSIRIKDMSDRDTTGYSRLVVQVYNRVDAQWAVLLTPFIPDPK